MKAELNISILGFMQSLRTERTENSLTLFSMDHKYKHAINLCMFTRYRENQKTLE